MTAGSVSLIDVATGASVATLPTAVAPHEVAVSHDGKWAVVAEYGDRAAVGHSLLVIDVARGTRAFVTNIRPGSVSVFDLDSRVRTGLHAVGTLVEGIAVTPDGREVWAGGNTSKLIHIVDPTSGAVTGTIAGFGMPYLIAITPDGRRAVVTDPGDEKTHVVDVAARRITAAIEVPAVNGDPASPQGVTLSPDGRFAVVTLKGANQVVWVDLATDRITARFATGGGSDGVGYSPVVAHPGPGS